MPPPREQKIIRVPPDLRPPQRIDLFLTGALGFTRAKIKSWIEAGCVTLEDRVASKAGVLLRGGERIGISIPESGPLPLKAEPIPLDILYEDGDLLVLNKPAGLVVHPSAGHWEGTLVNALLFHFKKLSGVDPERPGIVHRLDKDTSGILLVAKNDRSHLELSRQFKDRKMEKVYLALVRGKPARPEGILDQPIGRCPRDRKKMAPVLAGRSALTRYRVVKQFADFALLECAPLTGRTHQIRVHLAAAGHPVLGDAVYGRGKAPFEVSRQLLHAWKITLAHPVGGKLLSFEAPIPEDFRSALRCLGVSWS